MSTATTESKPPFWKRTQLWLEAMDDAVHTTEADLLGTRMERLEARVRQLETSALSGAGPDDASGISTIVERA